MGVLMQAFYWDCPQITHQEYAWWTYVQGHLPELRREGFTALWLPPCNKAAGATSMGYDPYDLFDFGEFDQRGNVRTWFGSRAELVGLIHSTHAQGMEVYADIVYNHNSGGELEHNPDFNRDGYTRFTPGSGRFARNYRCFHPNRFERWDGESWGDMPDFCHRNPYVYEHLMEHARTLICELGYDGFRFDFVKGYGSWMVKAIQERHYQRGDTIIHPFGVAESWSSDREIADWLDEANRWSDNPISAFDFPLRYRLKDLCDTYGYSLRGLLEPGTMCMDKPFQAVTFVDNHDFRGGGSPPIVQDKLLAYAFILTHPGYPCVFWQDYFERGLGQPGLSSGIAALVRAHESSAGGEMVVRHLEDDLYIMERLGTTSQPGLVFVLNNRGDRWQGQWVDTSRASTRYVPVAWWGHDGAAPLESWSQADGRGQFWAPPRGYVVYAPQLT